MDRRNFIAAVGGALAYANGVPSLAQYVIPDGQVRLVFNENPYGPKPQSACGSKGYSVPECLLPRLTNGLSDQG